MKSMLIIIDNISKNIILHKQTAFLVQFFYDWSDVNLELNAWKNLQNTDFKHQ